MTNPTERPEERHPTFIVQVNRLNGACCLLLDALCEALGIYRIVDWLARRLP